MQQLIYFNLLCLHLGLILGACLNTPDKSNFRKGPNELTIKGIARKKVLLIKMNKTVRDYLKSQE